MMRKSYSMFFSINRQFAIHNKGKFDVFDPTKSKYSKPVKQETLKDSKKSGAPQYLSRPNIKETQLVNPEDLKIQRVEEQKQADLQKAKD